jgi:hypothetical protein
MSIRSSRPAGRTSSALAAVPRYAHLGPRIARTLREPGYNVRAADDERQLDGLDDEQLLELAVEESRVMVTFDVKDFTVLARRWAEAGRSHAGPESPFRVNRSTTDYGANAIGLLQLAHRLTDGREFLV